MSHIVRPFTRAGRVVPGVWMATVRFVRPDGTVFPTRHNGEGSRKIIRAKTDKGAEAAAEEHEDYLRAKHASARHDEALQKTTDEEVPTFAESAAVWLDLMKVKAAKGEKKLSSVDAVESCLRLHVLPFVGSVPIDQFTDDVVDQLEAKWVRGGYQFIGPWKNVVKVKPLASLSTRNNRISPVNAILKFAVERKRIKVMPCTIKIPSVQADEAEFYPPETYEKLLDAALSIGHFAYVTVLLGGDAGLRRGEIIGLNRADVDLKAGEIVVRRSIYWHKKVRHETVPKGRKVKRIPCTPRLVAALKKICAAGSGARVLTTEDGGEITPKMIKRVVMKVEEAAGLEQTGRIHILRHSFCSHLAGANVPLIAIAGLARHSDLRVTQRYMHLAPTALRQAVDMLVKSRALGGMPVLPGDEGAA